MKKSIIIVILIGSLIGLIFGQIIFKNYKGKKYLNETGNIYYIQDDKLFAAESDIIRNLSKESCVIVGRCADYVLKDNSSVISVFLYSDDENKVKRAVKYYREDDFLDRYRRLYRSVSE